MSGLSFEHLERARDALAGRLPPTPLIQVDPALHPGLWLKCECLQPTGSFKIRGATYRIAALPAAQLARGIVGYSTGNHAQAVARAAADAGAKSTLVMSPDVPDAKVRAVIGWGASVVMAEPNSHARRTLAEEIARDTGATLIPPYNDFDIMAGQGSIGFELAAQLATLVHVAVYVPVGGGGLIAGVAAALKALEPTCLIIGVEPELEADAAASLRAGRIVTSREPSGSIADAIKVQALGELTFPIIRSFVDDIVTVTEAEIAQSTIDLFEKHGLVVEPSGATAFAAATRSDSPTGTRVGLLTGGNIDMDLLQQLRRARDLSVGSPAPPDTSAPARSARSTLPTMSPIQSTLAIPSVRRPRPG